MNTADFEAKSEGKNLNVESTSILDKSILTESET